MLPRRFWVLVGWVIGLSTLAVAAGVAETTYNDLYALADCAAPAAAPFYETCRDFRLMQGAAAMGGALVKVPAVGLGLVAAAIAWISRREEQRASTVAGSNQSSDGAGPAHQVPEPRSRRSKVPSTPVMNASNG